MVKGVENQPPEVPALKAAVEQRMAELGLSPTDLVDATGATYQGLLHLRQGRRKKYQRRLTGPVCAVFGWTPDSIERILAGGEPTISEGTGTGTVRDAGRPIRGEPSNAELLEAVLLLQTAIEERFAEMARMAVNAVAALESIGKQMGVGQLPSPEVPDVQSPTPTSPQSRSVGR